MVSAKYCSHSPEAQHKCNGSGKGARIPSCQFSHGPFKVTPCFRAEGVSLGGGGKERCEFERLALLEFPSVVKSSSSFMLDEAVAAEPTQEHHVEPTELSVPQTVGLGIVLWMNASANKLSGFQQEFFRSRKGNGHEEGFATRFQNHGPDRGRGGSA